jgi:hypothetical protein
LTDGWVYLLHFERALGRRSDAHYRGFTTDPQRRLREHASIRSRSRYTRAFAAAGVPFVVGGLWRGGRREEHLAKGVAAKLICAVCAGRDVSWDDVLRAAGARESS